MRRLVWAFAGHTYHIVGNLMHWLLYIEVKIDYLDTTILSRYMYQVQMSVTIGVSSSAFFQAAIHLQTVKGKHIST